MCDVRSCRRRACGRPRSCSSSTGRCAARHAAHALQPLRPTEDKPLYPTSIYAITKRDHEEMALAFGQAYDVPAVALRFFNIYGSRQALTNPYTGVAAIFCGRMLSGQVPLIYEDGQQQRDFVHVSDIVQACRLALERPGADHQVVNVGTGRPVSVRQVAELLARELSWTGGFEVRAEIPRRRHAPLLRRHRAHPVAARLRAAPPVRRRRAELVAWVADQQGVSAPVAAEVDRQLESYGLLR